jgi:hypothetical protein
MQYTEITTLFNPFASGRSVNKYKKAKETCFEPVIHVLKITLYIINQTKISLYKMIRKKPQIKKHLMRKCLVSSDKQKI